MKIPRTTHEVLLVMNLEYMFSCSWLFSYSLLILLWLMDCRISSIWVD